MGNPDLYRVLNEVVPLDECEVYSWFPEPEYDPHTQPEDGEVSDGGNEFDEEEEELMVGSSSSPMEIDDDGDLPVSWGQAGMELDDVPKSTGMQKRRSERKSFVQNSPIVRPVSNNSERGGGILWSANYFFYSK
jgi:hypothetical protein